MSKIVAGALAVALFSLATMARAALITWTLTNVSFADGGSASGSFVVDPVSFTVGTFDVKTTAGSSMTTGFEYTPANSSSASGLNNLVLRTDFPNGDIRAIVFLFGGTLPSAGGSVSLKENSFEALNSPVASLATRLVTAGSVTGIAVVPEPATFTFLGVGLALLLLRRRLN